MDTIEVPVAALVRASRRKFRYFRSARGSELTVEDLWDLSIDDIDTMAVGLSKQLSPQAESFRSSPSRAATSQQKRTEDMLQILKWVLRTKEEEDTKRKTDALRRQEADTYRQIIAKKELTEIEGKSLEDLRAQLAALESEED